jgi:hypothetical protein
VESFGADEPTCHLDIELVHHVPSDRRDGTSVVGSREPNTPVRPPNAR